MPSSSSRSPRSHSGSRSIQASQSFYPGGASTSSSRPFLNMLNPMARQYQGYTQANQSLLEEEDEARSSADEENAEAGRSRSTIFQSTAEDIPMSKSRTHQHHVSWDASPHVLHPNIQQEDALHEPQSSDDEVPQSFMIEATSKKSSKKGKSKSNSDSGGGRSQPLHSVAGRKLPPVLPTHTTSLRSPTSPRPGFTSTGNSHADRPASRTSSDGHDRPKQMRGLDAYERALWNWVNVYNLDAFLQETYYYYEGKGIYSIALSRGLNLLSVTSLSLSNFGFHNPSLILPSLQHSRLRHRIFNVLTGMC
jgi:autophagy-related protein 9